MKSDSIYDCAIIGGGPGGLVAGVYLARFKRKVVIIDGGDSRARWIPKIRNFAGFYDGVSGARLLKKLWIHVKKYNVPVIQGNAVLRRANNIFKIKINNEMIVSRKVILAIGMKDVQPEFENLDELRKSGLLAYCPICDGFEYNQEKVGLLVQNNEGLKKLKSLRAFSPKLFVFKTKDFDINPRYINFMNEHGIKFDSTVVEKLSAAVDQHGLLVVTKKSRKPVFVKVAYVGLGTKTANSVLKHLNKLKRTKQGFIITDSHQRTSIKGLFAVGDCVNGLSQISVAAAHAAVAATTVHNELLM